MTSLLCWIRVPLVVVLPTKLQFWTLRGRVVSLCVTLTAVGAMPGSILVTLCLQVVTRVCLCWCLFR